MGRTDDMLIINGINLFPSQIEEVVMRIPEVATNYIIQVEKRGDLDHLTVKVEIYPKLFLGDPSQLEALKGRIIEELRSAIILHPSVELHEPNSLPVSEGKAKRVIDLRPKE
jgi:phenylacetate-CoA ligase